MGFETAFYATSRIAHYDFIIIRITHEKIPIVCQIIYYIAKLVYDKYNLYS